MRETTLKYKAWIYRLGDGWQVVVGKSDADNDIISTEVVEPEEWWFHVASVPGSHVILTHPEGEEPTKELLKLAAAIAAWHSKARGSKKVAVHACKGKQVSKPRGAKAGLVHISRFTEFIVYPRDPATLPKE